MERISTHMKNARFCVPHSGQKTRTKKQKIETLPELIHNFAKVFDC